MIHIFLTNRKSEQIATFLLSIATVCSAWCAYQSSRWSGVQSMSLAEANAARTQATQLANKELMIRIGDVLIGMEYMNADENGDKVKAQFWWRRMRPQLQVAFKAWLATNPKENVDAPRGPFLMKEYSSEVLEESERKDALATQRVEDARNANQTSDIYVLLTVIFASVLLFGGIATKMQNRQSRLYMIAFGWVVWAVAFACVLTLPIK